jgi:hypothetical protein
VAGWTGDGGCGRQARTINPAFTAFELGFKYIETSLYRPLFAAFGRPFLMCALWKMPQDAFQFLQLISQEANLILLGMLADACDECLVLTRFFDREAFRLEEMVRQIDTFKRKLQWLFAGRGCLDTGYTSLALTHLRKGKLVPIPGQAPVTLGGHEASQSLVIECLGHMVAWSNLATEVATTEFPDFELLACCDLAFPLSAVIVARVEHCSIATVSSAFAHSSEREESRRPIDASVSLQIIGMSSLLEIEL